MTNFEILAPVGDEKNFYMAINNGADAIYLGLKNFNARDKAQNFDCENIRHYVQFAHLFGVKVYVTINIILTNEEIPLLLEMVKRCVESKVDAFIVQDLGVAYLLKNTFNNIVLHASTQMGIHNLEGAKIAEKMGFSRIVVSRETSKEDIIDIKKNTNLEIEYFVQGALCVCFSGNCYYSSIEKNESGNRGRCLQFCRLLHTAYCNEQKVNKGFLLSTTDLCLLDRLKELKELGICSLKIEGRLRRPAYVGYLTKIYSQAKVALQQNKNININENLENIKKLFYRGEYNKGIYLNQINNKNIINSQFQNHRGVLIGRVLNVQKFKDIYQILIATNGYQINKNDGLKFVYNNNELSLGVGSVKRGIIKNEYLIYTKTQTKEDSEVYLTVDSSWENTCEENLQKIKIDAYFEAKLGKKPLLKLKSGNIEISQVLFENCQKAISQPINYNQVKETLNKMGDEPFYMDKLTCDLDNVFIVKSQLNELRRKAIELLKQKLINSFENKNCKKIEVDFSFYNKTLDEQNVNFNLENNKYVVVNEQTNLESIKEEDFNYVFSPINFNINVVISFLNKVGNNSKKVYLNMPKYLRKEDFVVVNEILNNLDKTRVGLVANNIYALSYIQKGFEVLGGVYLNIANHFSAIYLKNLGVTNFVKTFESFANSFDEGLIYVGKPALMTLCHCPFKTSYNYSKCQDCKFTDNLIYKNQSGKQMRVVKTKIINCLFELISQETVNKNKAYNKNVFLDFRW